MPDGFAPCCDDLQSAIDTTFINPIDSPAGWLLYGTDYETVSAGAPELRYWPVLYCPFCGTKLAAPPPSLLRRSRRFGYDTA